MNFKIPFTVSTLDKLKKRSKPFSAKIKHKKNSNLQTYLNNTETKLTREEYLGICLRNLTNNLLIGFIFSTTFLFLVRVSSFLLFGLILAICFSGFVLISQIVYPKVYSNRKEKNIEKNLISALEDILIQLNSGVPLYSILVNISTSDYGELSNEFKKIVRKINAGMPQIEVLEEIGEKNPSVFFRRALWQISNGMRSGSDISIIIRDSVRSLNEEQLIQIQNYGNKLNPMIMFYMLISVIIPALSVTFLTILSSMLNLPARVNYMIYIGMLVMITIIQVMFLGVIRSLRPSLL